MHNSKRVTSLLLDSISKGKRMCRNQGWGGGGCYFLGPYLSHCFVGKSNLLSIALTTVHDQQTKKNMKCPNFKSLGLRDWT